MTNVECVGCSEQFDQDEKFQTSEFATDEYCKYCSYNAHEQALLENGLDPDDVKKEMEDWKIVVTVQDLVRKRGVYWKWIRDLSNTGDVEQ